MSQKYKLLIWIYNYNKNKPKPSNPITIPTKPTYDLVYEAAKQQTVIKLSKKMEYDDESKTFYVCISEMYNSSSSSLEGIDYSSYSYNKSTGIFSFSQIGETSSETTAYLTISFSNSNQPITIVYQLNL